MQLEHPILGSLKASGRAAIVGEKSAGAVLVSLFFTLLDDGRMMMPASLFFDGAGRPIEGSGVVPDVEVLPTPEDLAQERDPALDAAVARLAPTPTDVPVSYRHQFVMLAYSRGEVVQRLFDPAELDTSGVLPQPRHIHRLGRASRQP